jgi:hypothetical protein
MLKVKLSFLIWLLPHAMQAQPVVFPEGLYMSLEELQQGKPTDHRNILVETKKCAKDITAEERCIFSIVAAEPMADPDMITKDAWAYSSGDSLFLNCRHFKKLHAQYALALTGNRYIAFYAFSGNDAAYIPAVVLGGAIGAAIVGGVKATQTGDDLALYVMDVQTGRANYVDTEYMVNFLSDVYPLLLPQFNQEPFRNRSATHLKYFEKINKGEIK